MRSFAPISSHRSLRHLLSRDGFTLIEVLVATVVLAFASMAVYQVTISSFDINRKLTNESDAYLSLGMGMQALDRDIAQIFSPQLGSTTPPPDNTPEAFWSAPQREDGLRRTRFTGSKEKLTFISTSHRRLQVDAKEIELAKITYEIVQEKDGSYSLQRAEDTDVFDYEDREMSDKAPNKFKILEGLTSAHFAFYRGDKERWEEQWDSEAPYTEDISRFPTLVAIELQFPNPDNAQNILKWRSEFSTILALNHDPSSAGNSNVANDPNNPNGPNNTGNNNSGGGNP